MTLELQNRVSLTLINETTETVSFEELLLCFTLHFFIYESTIEVLYSSFFPFFFITSIPVKIYCLYTHFH